MNSEWSLEVLYKGFDDPKFAADFEKFDGIIGKINSLAEGINSMQPKEAVMSYLTLSEELSLTMMSLYMYASLRSSANTKDAEAQSVIGRLMAKISGTTRADTVIKNTLRKSPSLTQSLKASPCSRSMNTSCTASARTTSICSAISAKKLWHCMTSAAAAHGAICRAI